MIKTEAFMAYSWNETPDKLVSTVYRDLIFQPTIAIRFTDYDDDGNQFPVLAKYINDDQYVAEHPGYSYKGTVSFADDIIYWRGLFTVGNDEGTFEMYWHNYNWSTAKKNVMK